MTPERQIRKLKKKTKALILSAGKRVPTIRTRFREMLYERRARRYARMCERTEVDSRLVVFECFAGRSYSCSPRALYRAMLVDARFADYTFVWVLRPRAVRALKNRGGYNVITRSEAETGGAFAEKIDRLFGAEALEELKRAMIVSYASVPYYDLHARAGYWISNYIVPTHMPVREGQVYLQAWHGTPLKRLGCDIEADKQNAMYAVSDIHTRYSREGARFTRLLSPSAFASEKLASAFDLISTGREDVIIEEGYPRNDILFNATPEQVAAIRERLEIPEGKRVVLYAPTFRDNQHDSGVGYTFDAGPDFDVLRERLGEDHVILFRPHYLVANAFDFESYEGFVYDVSRVTDINDLYLISDVLVTDYSSVFFDFANLERSIIFFMYDLEDYAEKLRGFYLNLDELPGPIVRTVEDLADSIIDTSAGDRHLDERYRAFNAKFTYLDDGNASQRVLDALFGSTSTHGGNDETSGG